VTIRVGGEVDSLCGRCKLVLAHTVLAMVGPSVARVRCNTCGSDHAYRRSASPSAVPARKSASSRPARVVLSFEDQLHALRDKTPKAYSPQVTFQVDDLVAHPTFGLGIVRVVRRDKVDVVFKAAERTLVHGRPSPSGTESRHTGN